LIKSRQVDDKEFITIVFEEKVSKGFGMISLGGYIMSEIIPMIEGTHRLNSISTTYHRGSLETKILIVEGEW
jgi:ribulose 1,5-bisphosphate synthetase/thiazole synthase